MSGDAARLSCPLLNKHYTFQSDSKRIDQDALLAGLDLK